MKKWTQLNWLIYDPNVNYCNAEEIWIKLDRIVISLLTLMNTIFLIFAVLRMPVEVYTNVITMVNCQACLHPYGVFITTILPIHMSVYM